MPNTKPMPPCGCPVAAFQKMISGKYKLRIASDGSREIAPRVLSRELKALTQTGLIDRRDYGVVPPKVEYRLTRKGRSFVPVIAAIRRWGTRHLTAGSAAPDAAALPDGRRAAVAMRG